MNFFLSHLVRGLRPLFLALLASVTLTAAPLPFSALDENPALAIPKVSTNGKYVALRGEIDGTQYLALLDTTTMELKPVATLSAAQLLSIMWKGDSLLVLLMLNDDGTSEFRTYDLKTQKVDYLSKRLNLRAVTVLTVLPEDPDRVMIQSDSGSGYNLAKFNLRTGKSEVIENSDLRVRDWIVNSQGEAVAAVCNDGSTSFIRWRPAANVPWRQTELGKARNHRLVPFGLHPDQKRLLAFDPTGNGTISLVAVDPATLQKEVIFQHAEIDVESATYWLRDSSVATGIIYEDGQRKTLFIDPAFAKIQAVIDASLPGTYNEVQSISNDRNVLVILARSDRDSGMYYVLNLAARKLAAIGSAYATRDPAAMGSSRAFSFPSKDGLKIRGRLLLPPGNPPKPPVLLMLGRNLAGPRAQLLFDAETQVYASRGYAVAVIDYRGCDGYGQSFLKAGDYQFATGMQDDITAGLDFLESQGWIDGTKIGMVTTGYGSVVGLQALTHTNRFKVWLNLNSTIYENPLTMENLALSDRKESEILADLGSKAAAKSLIDSLNPGSALAQVTVPSFHINEYAYLNTPFIKKHIKSSPDQLEAINVPEIKDPKAARAARIAAREKMMVFLAKWLPPAAPAK